MKQSFLIFFTILYLVHLFSCIESTSIGAELLEEDQVNLVSRSDIPLSTKTVVGKAVPTYSPFQALQLRHMLVGQLEDDVFGTSTASIYTQLSRGSGRPDNAIVIDSLILSIAYDTTGDYGDVTLPLDIEVFRVIEPLDGTIDYNSDQILATDAVSIGQTTATFSLDSVQTLNYTGDEPVLVTEAPQLRIPLDIIFGELLIADTSIYQSDTTFRDFLNGIYIKPTSSAGIIPLRFENAASRLTMYYRTVIEGANKEYSYPFQFGQARFNNFENNYTNATVEPLIGAEDADLLYMQSMAGTNIDISFPDLSGLENVVINKAELELTVALNANQPVGIFPLVEQMIVTSTQDNDGERTAISDAINAIIANSSSINSLVFGGIPVEEDINGTTITKYRINISSHFQDIINNNAPNNIILTAGTEELGFYINITPKAENANQVVLFGDSHPDYAPRINLVYTNL